MPKQDTIKTLLLVGGVIHDWKGVGDVLEPMLGRAGRFDVTRVDDDLSVLAARRLAPYELVVFYWTLGKLNDARRRGILDHIGRGNGFVGVHSAADSFRGDKAWRRFIGGYFITHPRYRRYQVGVTKVRSPITEGVEEFFVTDEQYITKHRGDLNVLANALWQGRTMPVLWTKPHKRGRVFYTALGHDPKACRQAMFRKTFLRGCLWAVNR